MIFIEKLMEVLEIQKISPYKLCKDLGYSNSVFTSWKNGKVPSIEKLAEISNYLEISSDYLLGITRNESPSLSQKEWELIRAYRDAAPGIQQATRKLLDLPDAEKERSSSSRTG